MSVFNEKQSEIEESIKSILNQTYKEIELIIINDNPKNRNIKKILDKFEDKRIKLIENNKNIGLGLSLNKGISLARGEYIARMDADDISKSNRIEKQVEYLKQHKEVVLLGTDAIKIDEKGNTIGTLISEKKYIEKLMRDKNCFIHPTIIFNKEYIKKIGGYRSFPCAQDYDLYSRIIYNGGKIANLEEKLLYYRVRNNSITSKKELLQLLIAEYIKKINKEREKTGQDIFSNFKIEELVEEYEKNNEVFLLQKKRVKKYKKNSLKYILVLLQLFFESKYYRIRIFEYLKTKIRKLIFKIIIK